jgi:hypothetical protein
MAHRIDFIDHGNNVYPAEHVEHMWRAFVMQPPANAGW